MQQDEEFRIRSDKYRYKTLFKRSSIVSSTGNRMTSLGQLKSIGIKTVCIKAIALMYAVFMPIDFSCPSEVIRFLVVLTF